MGHGLYFIQGCPTCGRRVQVRMEYLGKYVTCHHCGAAFQANGAAKVPEAQSGEEREPHAALHSRPVSAPWKAPHFVAWPFGPDEEM